MTIRPESSYEHGVTTVDKSSTVAKSGPVPGQEQEVRFRQGRVGMDALRDLVEETEKSVATLTHAAENVENAGLKLLLKAVATTRALHLERLRQVAGTADPAEAPADWTRHRALTDGMTDIQASMSVQREERQHLALYELVQSEEDLLARYDAVLGSTHTDNVLPQTVATLVQEQREEVAAFQQRLSHLDEEHAPLVVARVYDSFEEAQVAVGQLHVRGLAHDQVDALRVGSATVQQSAEVTAPASPRSTVVAGAVTGAVVGGVIGLTMAIFVLFAPQLIGWLTVGPWALFLGSLIPGAVIGAVFGWLIGQNRVEDDRNVSARHLREGECLVAAYPTQAQVAVAEDVLQIHHARTLNT